MTLHKSKNLILNCPHAIGQKKKWANEKAVMYTVFWVYWCHHPLFYVHPTVENYILKVELQSSGSSSSSSTSSNRSSTSGSGRSSR